MRIRLPRNFYNNGRIQILFDPLWQNLLILVIIGVFLIAASIQLLFPALKSSEDNIVTLQHAIAVNSRDLLELFLDLQLEDLATSGGQLLKDPEGYEDIINLFFETREGFSEVTLFDTEGAAIFSGGHHHVTPLSLPPNLAKGKFYFEEPLNGRNYVSSVFFDPEAGPLIRISAPVKEDGQVVAVIVSEVDLFLVWEIVRRTSVEDGKVYIVDGFGTIIADPDLERSRSGENLRYREIVDLLVQGESLVNSSRYVNENGKEVLAHGMLIPSVGWGVIVEQDAQKALEQRNQTLLFAVIFSAIGLVLILLLLVGTLRLIRTARTLRKERDQTSAIVASLGDGLIMYSPEKKIIFLNPKAQEMLWISSKQVLGKSLKNKNAFNTSLLQNFYNISTLPLQSWKTKEFTTETPKKIVLEITHIVLREPKGKNLGSMRVLHDITKEKEIEAIKSEFVSLASHQLRTPISGIKWSLDMLLKGEYGKLDGRQRKVVGETLHASGRMISVVNDLLDVSRIEEGRFGYRFSLQSLEDLVNKLVKRFSQQMQKKKLQLSHEKPESPLPKVSIDSEKMEMALQNIMDNAIKYTVERGKIKIYFEKSSTHLTFFIEDTGIGIPKDQQSRVFDKFFRASNAIKLQTTGSGLGLFIAKSITEAHGGTIGFVSKENKGSTFHVSLPISPKVMPRRKSKGEGERVNISEP